MKAPLIAVTGAAGKTGGAVAEILLAHGYPVRAIVRRKDERSQALAAKGAQIAIADLFDSEQLTQALHGAQRAYFAPPFAPNMTESGKAFLEAASANGIEAVAILSQWLASPDHPSIQTRMHAEIDRMFAAAPGIATITIAPGYFADNYLRLIDFAAQLGILPNLTGNSRNAPPSNEDIARVIAATLLNPAAHAGKRYRPTGPELLSVPEMAAILSRVLAHSVRSVPMPYWLFVKAARLQGVQPFDLDSLSYYVKDHRDGAFEFGAPSDDVLRVTGQPAESFETTARRYAALPKAQPTIARQIRAWLDFMRTPLSPGYNLAAYERRQGFPRLAKPLFAMQNARWRAERDASGVTAFPVA